ncbi:MAG: aminotransferase class V-fold PLP-dependent enzyme [Lysobacteraceae bacterium]
MPAVAPLRVARPASLEAWFAPFRAGVIGHDLTDPRVQGDGRVVYADWTASGRLYRPIEDYVANVLGPYVANTHTETTLTGTRMTHAYHQAQAIIKRHCNAGPNDVLIAQGSGMTGVVNKFQRILGLRIPEHVADRVAMRDEEKPLVVLTHMEHHSNQTSWEECAVHVEILPRAACGRPDLDALPGILRRNAHRPLKIGAFSACSNVTGIATPYHEMAAIMHAHGGVCFVDFAASAPYVDIDMHPADPARKLDAVYFSPHKVLGGPGASGVLLFDASLYRLKVPDAPGGGTVAWTNPWGGHRFVDNIEAREDGGTPGFLQTIRAALAVQVKEAMGVANIEARERELRELFLAELRKEPGIQLLEPEQCDRLCIFSFYSLEKHHNLIVRLLNDRFGVQVRGGCSCAGTYGHILLAVDPETSHRITCQIDAGDLSNKPGWVRVSLHPTMTDAEVVYVARAIHEVMRHYDAWKHDYDFDIASGEFRPKAGEPPMPGLETFRPV